MSRILIIFVHPALEKSRVNRELVDMARNISGITLHDLYEAYPASMLMSPLNNSSC